MVLLLSFLVLVISARLAILDRKYFLFQNFCFLLLQTHWKQSGSFEKQTNIHKDYTETASLISLVT